MARTFFLAVFIVSAVVTIALGFVEAGYPHPWLLDIHIVTGSIVIISFITFIVTVRKSILKFFRRGK